MDSGNESRGREIGNAGNMQKLDSLPFIKETSIDKPQFFDIIML